MCLFLGVANRLVVTRCDSLPAISSSETFKNPDVHLQLNYLIYLLFERFLKFSHILKPEDVCLESSETTHSLPK